MTNNFCFLLKTGCMDIIDILDILTLLKSFLLVSLWTILIRRDSKRSARWHIGIVRRINLIYWIEFPDFVNTMICYLWKYVQIDSLFCVHQGEQIEKNGLLFLFFLIVGRLPRWALKSTSVISPLFLTEEQGGDHRDAGVSSPGNTAFRPVRCVYLSLKGISMHNHPVVYTLLNAILSVLETLTVSKKGDMLSFWCYPRQFLDRK